MTSVKEQNPLKEEVIKYAGILAALYAIYPFAYSLLDNVTNTGDQTADRVAEGLHDGFMKFATIFTVLQAVIYYIVFRIVLHFLPL